MKKMFGLMLTGFFILSLVGCEGFTDTNTDNTSDTNDTDVLVGGSVDNPVPLQFGKPYQVTKSTNATYVKFTVKQFQRIVFERVTDEEVLDGSGMYGSEYYITIFDTSMNKYDNWAQGDTWKIGYSKTGTQDFIFLEAGTYYAKYKFVDVNIRHDQRIAKIGLITAYDMNITQLPEIVNKGAYVVTSEEAHKFYSLKMDNTGKVNFHGNYMSEAILYDYDLNIVENIDSKDINVTLPQGNYLYHPTSGEYTITFLNP